MDYQLEFATWLASSSNHSAAGPTGEWPSAEQLLMDAAAALEDATSSSTGGNRRTGSCNGGMGLPSTADTAASAGSRAAVRRRSTAEVAVWDKASPVYGSRKLEQLVQVHLLLSQVSWHLCCPPCCGLGVLLTWHTNMIVQQCPASCIPGK